MLCAACQQAKKLVGRGLCGSCYMRMRRAGRIQEFLKSQFPNGVRPSTAPCRVADCGRRPGARGLCMTHYRAKRRAEDPALREKAREYARARYWIDPERRRAEARAEAVRNPEVRKERLRDWRAANVTRLKEWRKRHYAEKSEYYKAKSKKWAAANPDQVRVQHHTRRTRQENAPGYANKVQIAARVAFWGGRCWLCSCDWYALPRFDQCVDHVIPLSRGGSNWSANLRPACRSCNSRKHSSLPKEVASWS